MTNEQKVQLINHGARTMAITDEDYLDFLRKVLNEEKDAVLQIFRENAEYNDQESIDYVVEEARKIMENSDA